VALFYLIWPQKLLNIEGSEALKNSSLTLEHRREGFVFKAKTSGPDFDLQTLKMSAPDQIHMFKITAANSHPLSPSGAPAGKKGFFSAKCKTQNISALHC